jgi:hypothetical protein
MLKMINMDLNFKGQFSYTQITYSSWNCGPYTENNDRGKKTASQRKLTAITRRGPVITGDYGRLKFMAIRGNG